MLYSCRRTEVDFADKSTSHILRDTLVAGSHTTAVCFDFALNVWHKSSYRFVTPFEEISMDHCYMSNE